MSAWTDPALERLTVLWSEGKSASQVANLLNREFPGAGFSRSAVIGKVHRLGLSGREKPSLPSGRLPRAPAVARAPYQNVGLAFGTRKRQPAPKGVMVLSPVVGGDVATAARIENMAARVQPAENVLELARAFVPLPGCAPVPFGHGGCRWPTGGHGAEMTQCGARRAAGEESYCARHAQAGRPAPATKEKLDRHLGIPRGRRAA